MKRFKIISLFLALALIILFFNSYAAHVGEQGKAGEQDKVEQGKVEQSKIVEQGKAVAQVKSDKREITRTFRARGIVQIQTMSGSCSFKKGKNHEIIVQVIMDSSAGLFEPIMEEERYTNTLILRDKSQGSDEGSNARWIVTVPEKTGIKSSSISGNFSVVGLNGEIAAKTISGDIIARDCSGNLRFVSVDGVIKVQDLKGTIQLKGISSNIEFKNLSGKMEINTASGEIRGTELNGDISCAVASGDVEINKAEGGFKIKTASGDIDASDITILAASEFKVTSGEVEVVLSKSAEHNLTLVSTAGSAILNYNGNPIKGWFEFKALSERGNIVSPFKFDKEEIKEEWNQKYDVKGFQKDSDSPKIHIFTSSGEAVLKEK